MKREIILLCFLFYSIKLNAQFKILPINKVKVNSVLQNGGYVLGIEELYVSITDVWRDSKYDILKISGYVQNAYNRASSNDTFDIDIYDSTNAQKLLNNLFENQESIAPTKSLISDKHGMFTIYLKENEIAEINARFAAYPVRIYIAR